MGIFDSFLPDDTNTRGNVLDAVQAMGMGLLQGDREHPFGNNLAQNLAAVQAGSKTGASREALKAILMAKGFSAADAEKYSQSEAATKLAIQSKDDEGLSALAAGFFNPGGATNLGMGAKASPAAPGGPAAGVTLNGSQTDKAKSVYDGLIQRGLPPIVAAGMTGNVGAESNFDPNAVGDSGTAFGYHQARADRADNLRTIAQRRGVAWNDHDAQLDNIAAEFNGGDAGMVKARRLIESDPNITPEKAAAIIAQYGERPNAQALQDSLAKRTGLAAQAFNMFGQPRTQTADASGAPLTMPPGASGLNPGRKVQVANDENQTQVLEGRMGMYPPNVYGVTKPPVQTADAADKPATDALPAEFRVPPGPGGQGQPAYAPDSVTARAVAARQAAAAAEDREKVQRGLAIIASSGRYGDRGKALAEAVKLQIQPLLKNMEDTDAQKLVKASGMSDDQAKTVLAGAIPGNAQTGLQKEYGSYVQQELANGRTPLSQIDYDLKLRGGSKPEQNTTIKNFANPVVKGLGDQFLDARKEAAEAAKAIPAIHQARSLLDEGVFTGPLADQKLKLAQIGSVFGIQNPKIESTEAFGPVIGQQVLANIKVLGANPSNSDRDFAEKMAGGKITLNEGSLRRIMDINENAHRVKIQNYNKSVEPMVNTADDEMKPFAGVLKVQEPGAYQKPERAQAPAQATPAAPPMPKIGDVQKGHQFLGGNPADPKSWRRVQQQEGPVL